MKNQYLVTKKVISDSAIIEIRGHQTNTTGAIAIIRRLQELYDKDDGWRLTHWDEERHGRLLIAFEMEAERDQYGKHERVMFSMARQAEPVRRYR